MGASRVVLAKERFRLMKSHRCEQKFRRTLKSSALYTAQCVCRSRGRCLDFKLYDRQRCTNHGDCAQPCRWKYHLFEENREGQYFPVEEHSDGTYLYNSRDLCMIEHIPELVKAGVSSLKIQVEQNQLITPLLQQMPIAMLLTDL